MIGMMLYGVAVIGAVATMLMLVMAPQTASEGGAAVATTTMTTGRGDVDGWVCGECGTENEATYDMCRECLAQR